MNKRDIKSIVRLTVEWLEYLDIYKIEGCTEEDIYYGLSTAGARGDALKEQLDALPRKEWQAVVHQVIEAVNADFYEEV